MHTLSLSGIHVTLPCAAAELLICIGGGRAPSPTWFTDLLSEMEKPGITSHILAIDKGVNLCRAVSRPPSLLIGDGDSASPEAWAWAVEHGAEVYRFPVEKDDSDTALSLRIAAQHFTRPLIILTAAAVAAHADISCVLADECETLFYLHAGESLTVTCDTPPRAISLLPFTEECAGVTTQGLHWELTGTVISARASTTISNIISPKNTARRFSIHLERGILGVYLCWQE